MDEKELEQLAQQVEQALRQSELRLVTAESCTGGWVAKLLTDIAGSSDWFERGYVSYSNESKQQMFGVNAETLERYGAVSQAVVEEMVAGALAESGADIAAAVSGIAGPGGGSNDKPVGTVWFAWQKVGGAVTSRRLLFAGDRKQVRAHSVAELLRGVLEQVG